jgi:hypothetical protein
LFHPFQTRSLGQHHAKPRAFPVVALVCLALLAFLTIAQVTHTHAVSSDTDHCPLCIVMHTAAPVVAAAAIINLVQVAVATPVLEVRRVCRHWHAQLFTRPPPAVC